MSSTTKAREPGVVVLIEAKRKRSRKPRFLTILFSPVLLVALFHFIAVTHTAAPAVVPTDCLGLLRTTDYTQVVHLQSRTEAMGVFGNWSNMLSAPYLLTT